MAVRLKSLAQAKALLKGLKPDAIQAISDAVGHLHPNSVYTWRKLHWPKFKLKPEAALTVEVMNHLRGRLAEGWVAIHFPAEAERSQVWWALLQAMGYFNGFPDILILIPGGRFAVVELKVDTKLSPAQLAFQDWAVRHNVPHLVARGIPDIEPWLTGIESVS